MADMGTGSCYSDSCRSGHHWGNKAHWSGCRETCPLHGSILLSGSYSSHSRFSERTVAIIMVIGVSASIIVHGSSPQEEESLSQP